MYLTLYWILTYLTMKSESTISQTLRLSKTTAHTEFNNTWFTVRIQQVSLLAKHVHLQGYFRHVILILQSCEQRNGVDTRAEITVTHSDCLQFLNTFYSTAQCEHHRVQSTLASKRTETQPCARGLFTPSSSLVSFWPCALCLGKAHRTVLLNLYAFVQ